LTYWWLVGLIMLLICCSSWRVPGGWLFCLNPNTAAPDHVGLLLLCAYCRILLLDMTARVLKPQHINQKMVFKGLNDGL
jgi:hypothetical protein